MASTVEISELCQYGPWRDAYERQGEILENEGRQAGDGGRGAEGRNKDGVWPGGFLGERGAGGEGGKVRCSDPQDRRSPRVCHGQALAVEKEARRRSDRENVWQCVSKEGCFEEWRCPAGGLKAGARRGRRWDMGSQEAGPKIAAILSVMETCKRLQITCANTSTTSA